MIETYACPGCGELFKADVEANSSAVVECPSCGSSVEVEGRDAFVPPPPAVNRNLVPQPAVYRPASLESAEARQEREERFGMVPAGNPPITRVDAPGFLGSLLGNLIWFVFGGFVMAVGYMTTGLLNMMTIIGIPTGYQGIKIGFFAAWPFGYYVEDRGAGCLGTVGNLIWFFTGGWILMIGHLLWALLFTVLIVTYPFAVMHFRMASLCLAPFGKVVRPY